MNLNAVESQSIRGRGRFPESHNDRLNISGRHRLTHFDHRVPHPARDAGRAHLATFEDAGLVVQIFKLGLEHETDMP